MSEEDKIIKRIAIKKKARRRRRGPYRKSSILHIKGR